MQRRLDHVVSSDGVKNVRKTPFALAAWWEYFIMNSRASKCPVIRLAECVTDVTLRTIALSTATEGMASQWSQSTSWKMYFWITQLEILNTELVDHGTKEGNLAIKMLQFILPVKSCTFLIVRENLCFSVWGNFVLYPKLLWTRGLRTPQTKKINHFKDQKRVGY